MSDFLYENVFVIVVGLGLVIAALLCWLVYTYGPELPDYTGVPEETLDRLRRLERWQTAYNLVTAELDREPTTAELIEAYDFLFGVEDDLDEADGSPDLEWY